MPKLKRPSRRRRGWPSGAITHLRFGFDMLHDGFGKDPDVETLRAAWEDLREQVMAAHEHHRIDWPSRPWAWWRFEHDIDFQGPPRTFWAEAQMLHELGELTPAETRRYRAYLEKELGIRRGRGNMDPAWWVPELEKLLEAV